MSPLLRTLRLVKLILGFAWGMSVLTLGLHMGLTVSPVLGMGVAAMGEYVLMYVVLDDLVRPVNVEVTGFLKLTAAMVVAGSVIFVIRDWQAILSALAQT